MSFSQYIGAGERNRTLDRSITNRELYRLSYASTFKARICLLASSQPKPIMTKSPTLSRYFLNSFCSGDNEPPFCLFISTQVRQAGMQRSGTPFKTPSAFNLPAALGERAPPFGIAKIFTPGKDWRNHLTNSLCSSCSLGIRSILLLVPCKICRLVCN